MEHFHLDWTFKQITMLHVNTPTVGSGLCVAVNKKSVCREYIGSLSHVQSLVHYICTSVSMACSSVNGL